MREVQSQFDEYDRDKLYEEKKKTMSQFPESRITFYGGKFDEYTYNSAAAEAYRRDRIRESSEHPFTYTDTDFEEDKIREYEREEEERRREEEEEEGYYW